jgi:hypothetical protein
MKSFIIVAFALIIIFALSCNVENKRVEIQEAYKVAKDEGVKKQDSKVVQKVNFLIDFSDYPGGGIDKWLESKGFYLDRKAGNRKLIELSANKGGLLFKALKPVRCFVINKFVNLKEFSKVRIEWGITQFPTDASYERENRNEALIVYIFFGDKKLSSGSFVIPDCPYFIGLFLSKDDKINKPYKGRYFHNGGRFVCVGNPEAKETVISEFDLVSAFQTYYKDEVPAITGLCLEVDTSSSGDGGKATAFIKCIEFLK